MIDWRRGGKYHLEAYKGAERLSFNIAKYPDGYVLWRISSKTEPAEMLAKDSDVEKLKNICTGYL